jgi:hypothetical protein
MRLARYDFANMLAGFASVCSGQVSFRSGKLFDALAIPGKTGKSVSDP